MTRLVVVGYGMAGTRLVERVRTHRPDADITVLGAERHPPYNRVLLSQVLAGQVDARHIALDGPTDVDLRLDTPVTAIDRARRQVRTADGDLVPYDALVLATGSRPVLPPVPGLRLDLPGVEVFRTLDDCRRILDHGARHTIVLGGGTLGLETARGLARRGAQVTLVHGAPHLMERQLDRVASTMVAQALERLGVRCLLSAQATQVLGGDRFRGLELADGRRLRADLLVVSCGVRPDTGLAQAAGLRVRRGVVVDAALRSVTDPAVSAVGDCAEHSRRVHGLVAPAWEQADVAALHIAGVDPAARYAGSRLVTRLKADGVHVAAMGEGRAGDDEAEVVRFIDPTRGTYKKVVIRADRLVGAILVGDMSTVGLLSQVFDRGDPVPPDRLALLFAEPPAPSGGSPRSPAGEPVCRCNSVTADTIRAGVRSGARTVTEIASCTRATTGCGTCVDQVAAVVAEAALDASVTTLPRQRIA